MRSLLLIVQREVQERVQAKSFRLFSAGLFVLVLGAILAIDRAPEIFGEDDYRLAVPADASSELNEALERFAELEGLEVDYVPYANEAEAQSLLDEGEVDAYLADGKLVYDDNESTSLTAVASSAVYAYELGQRLDGLNIPAEQRQALLNPEPVQVVVQDPGATNQGER